MMQSKQLLAAAMNLPIPNPEDFTTAKAPVGGVSPDRLRIVLDQQLRQKLVSRGMAEPLQIRRGRQENVLPIMLLYPEGNAPRRQSEATVAVQVQRSVSTAAVALAAPVGAGARRSLPTVEAMSTLIEKLKDVELTVCGELERAIDERIAHLKRQVSTSTADDIEESFRALGVAIDERRALKSHARAEAFRRVEADETCVERMYLCVLARP